MIQPHDRLTGPASTPISVSLLTGFLGSGKTTVLNNPAAPRWEVSNGEIAAQKVLTLGLFTEEGISPDVAR